MHRRLQATQFLLRRKVGWPNSSVQSGVIGPASGEHLVIDKGSPIYNEIDTKKLEQSPPYFTVTFSED
jgi:hypothetical protein